MTKEYPTLYARAMTGKILIWKATVKSQNNQVDIMISYGEFTGDRTTRWERNIQGVNIGKSNETNSWQQAEAKIESRIKTKKRKGYMTLEEVKDDIDSANAVGTGIKLLTDNRDELLKLLETYLPKNKTDLDGDVKPMLAKQYYRTKKNWTDPEGNLWSDRKYYYISNPHVTKEKNAVVPKFPCIGQPKINGGRALSQIKLGKALMKSRDGLEYIVHHINDFFNINNDIFIYEGEDIILDGELYIHGELLQDIMSAVKKANLNTPRIKLILFDLAISTYSNLERWEIIKNHIKPKLDIHLTCPIEIIKTVIINNEVEAQRFTDWCIKNGYEGGIFRDADAEYVFGGRRNCLTKLKRAIDEEFKIVDIIPQEKDSTKGNYTCINKNGEMFDVTPKGTDDFKRELLFNKAKYIGKNLTITFYEWTKDMKPLHIMNNLIRDYE